MTRLNPDKFVAVMAELGISDLTSISVLTLDRYLGAFLEGNDTAAKLITAMLKPKFPRQIMLYAHFDHDELADIGEQIGLSPDALRQFTSRDPLQIDAVVREDGSLLILGL
jgi:2-hydroxychromene-2-carboxylate isomerase